MNIALIVAGGSGTRMNSNTPKQFILVNDKPILVYTLEAFSSCDDIDEIIVVSNANFIEETTKIINEYQIKKVKFIVPGGDTRQESVFNGLKYLKNNEYSDEDIVLIHDACRPLVSEKIIIDNINACKSIGAAGTYLNCSDSVISLDGEVKTIDRNSIKLAQTPQSGTLKIMFEAHDVASKTRYQATDDCGLLNYLKIPFEIVNGNKQNIKITETIDLEIMNALLK